MVRSCSSSALLVLLFPTMIIFLLFFLSSFMVSVSSTITTSSPAHHNHHLRNNETDRLSLLAFKDALIADPHRALSSWNHSTHFCRWEGVACGRRHHQRVVELDLSSGGLVGPLSPHLGNLSFLRGLYLEDNNFRGNIPQQISQLFRLEALHLGNNSLSGPIPTNLVRCSNLDTLALYRNQLVGNLPTEFGFFTNLQVLLVHDNNFTGGVPHTLGNISSLGAIDLALNNFDGGIPNSLGQLKKSLYYLSLGGNGLSGMVPSSIYNLSELETLIFTINQLEGTLPSSIGNDFPKLQNFFIASNQFSGTLPVSLFTNASKLFALEVTDNNFVGQIPIEVKNLKYINDLKLQTNYFGSGGDHDDLSFITSLSNCTKLEYFYFGHNNFSGRLPASLTNLSITLKQLSFGGNQIFGSIPSRMSKLKNLAQFDAPNNFLSGTIPNDIGMFQQLQSLSLTNNRLIGKIPRTIGNLTSLYWLSLGDNLLEGNIEPNLEKCRFLQKLFMGNNRFTGNLPKQILSLDLLQIDLSNNYLNGSLPQEISQLKNLQYLNLSENKLSGEIPTTLGSCFSLEALSLARNFFQGSIPDSFGDLVVIEMLDLSRNNLTGKIPNRLENLQYLRYFNISFNNFEGEVPTKQIFQNVFGFSIIGNNKLCGGSDKLKLHKCPVQKSKKKKFPMSLKVIVGVFGSLSILGTLLALFTLNLKKKSSAKSTSNATELQRISYNEIREATNGFSSNNLIGVGSFASVYKGVLRESGSIVAVKVFNLMEKWASKSFNAECEILRRIRHRNLLKILTVCSSIDFHGNDFKALILEFMPYGSLEELLHPSSDRLQRLPRMLSFLQRLNIAIDVALALDYLHNCNETTIVHCDLKPSNVLLNEDLVACVSDFGLAKFLSQNQSSLDKSKTISNAIRGTMGYIPPEYGMGSPISTKGDVYSYGIMLLEMITGRKPTDKMFNESLSLHNFCNLLLVERDTNMVDIIPLVEEFQNETEEERSMTRSMKVCMLSAIEIGVVCSSESINNRMDIKDVLVKMQKIKEACVKIMNCEENANMESNI